MTGLNEDIITRLTDMLGPKGVVRDPDEIAPYLEEWRGKYHGKTRLVVRPASTEEVAKVIRLCAQEKIAVVPQGGNTGLVGGQLPFEQELLLNTARLNRIRAVDPANNTMTVEAGCILASLQQAAEDVDRLFPLSLASEGTCQIGGNLSSNAGGVHVLRYGNTRDLVLGLEVVLPDGQIWDGLRTLRKNNTGYDLKQLFIGAEGTLGVITAAVLKLFPRPRDRAVVFAALPSVQAAVGLLNLSREASGDAVSSFELVPRIGLDFVLTHLDGARDPLAERAPWYALIDLESGAGGNMTAQAERLLEKAVETGLVSDAVIARNESQAADLWRLRESLSEVQKHEGGSIKHDVSVPVSAIPEFIDQASDAVKALIPEARPVPFGHIGDGNIHFNVSQPSGGDKDAFLANWDRVSHAVHETVRRFDGSISAEHGIGVMKREELTRHKSAVELDLMRRIKTALDPEGLMNPGKVL